MLKLPPIDYGVSLTIYAAILEIEFGLMPDLDLVAEIFALQSQNRQVRILPSAPNGDESAEAPQQRLNYEIQFPKVFEPINLARSIAVGLKEHGYTVRVIRSDVLEEAEGDEVIV